jgi:hypothetical protein
LKNKKNEENDKKKRAIKKIKTKIGNQIKLNQTPKDKKKK